MGEAIDSKHEYILRHPTRALAALSVAWKIALFATVANCPGLGYDTSTTLLIPPATALSTPSSAVWNWIRWDAIYFVRVAERGYLFEQEWAWGYGYTRLLSHVSSAFVQSGPVSISAIAICGVVLSHVAHFLSVLVLHALTKSLFGYDTQSQRAFCLISAALHVISPAGAFLSAPYGESIFSLLNLTGFYLYSSALISESAGRRGRRDTHFLLAGIAFAVATTVRGNGILSGCLFAYDAIQGALQLLRQGISVDLIRRTGFVVLGGMTVALGSIIPQFIAFTEYCGGSTRRPWCEQLLPSIYGWVQAHYWNVGFLKYWTVSNLPLFILAAPMLVIMLYSSFVTPTGRIGPYPPSRVIDHVHVTQSALARLAIAQGILAFMALTTFHVQIINRIASGYPLWYWCLSSLALEHSKSSGSRTFAVAVQGMAMYALIQAVLFGSFLPPA
ncbi:GPI mannosyltransferase 2 [Talaromyces atroroseus]|uniref:GPI mannosyltransferase 2 n=1 Tax=Talaromyces atroroseus TaxID=1441469 RepID=A0A225B1Y2_TALAT|nr:GPI mannosyltransferase 2 [Talaromyces atroroseus]OKL59827.1 GPI mannosyltransferase 2 [Talaromyces atroroseus]